MFEVNNETSSEQSVGNRGEDEQTPIVEEAVFVDPSVQALVGGSFESLTIPIAIPLDPRFPKTTYARVKSISFTARDILDPRVLNREVDDSDDFDDVPKTKKQLPGDFVLKNNTVSAEMGALQQICIGLSLGCFICLLVPQCPTIIFRFLLSISFLVLVYIQILSFVIFLAQFILNSPMFIQMGLSIFFGLTIFCRRVVVEISDLILCTIFFILRMNNLTFSLHPRKNVVTLFEPAPNKISL